MHSSVVFEIFGEFFFYGFLNTFSRYCTSRATINFRYEKFAKAAFPFVRNLIVPLVALYPIFSGVITISEIWPENACTFEFHRTSANCILRVRKFHAISYRQVGFCEVSWPCNSSCVTHDNNLHFVINF